IAASSPITAKTASGGTIGIGAVDDPSTPFTDTLTVAASIDMGYSRLVVDGSGNTALSGVVTQLAAPVLTLSTLNTVPTGDYTFTAAGQTFTAHVGNDGTNNFLLIGRGREGWEFDTDGQGAVSSVNQNLGTPSAFVPAAYSDAIVNDLL